MKTITVNNINYSWRLSDDDNLVIENQNKRWLVYKEAVSRSAITEADIHKYIQDNKLI